MSKKDKNQTPAPKKSSTGKYSEDGKNYTPAEEHLQLGNITPGNHNNGAASTTQQQAHREKNGLSIPKIMEGDGPETQEKKINKSQSPKSKK